MGLVDLGPDTVRVFRQKEVLDRFGNRTLIPDEKNPVTVRNCWVQPIASTRGAFAARKVDSGQDVNSAYKLIARRIDELDWWVRVEWISHNGRALPIVRKFAVLGGPLYRNFSKAITHISCTLQEMR